MRVVHIVGARPNFMKASPVMRALKAHGEVEQSLIHTGQHYDRNMSQVFFDELDLPRPDINLGVGSGSHTWQTAQVMLRFEPAVLDLRPHWVLVYGDVNSTLAAALVCCKSGIPIAHVEAGLRSYDPSMPEETNRVLVDQVADLLFTPSRDAGQNLLREGIAQQRIRFVGNVMIDTLKRLLPCARKRCKKVRKRFGVKNYILVTLHRPSNVDDPDRLRSILAALHEIGRQVQVIFPAHPRTRERMASADSTGLNRIRFTEPIGYLDFLALQSEARFVVTDSGGMQEEATFLGVPCLTVRPNTERPITIHQGTNRLVTGNPNELRQAMRELLGAKRRPQARIEHWDGRAAERIAGHLASRTR